MTIHPVFVAFAASALRKSWSRDTAYEPELWTSARPEIGQCAVTALIVQDFFGGEIFGARNDQVSHYWNVADDVEIDLTAGQFDEPPIWAEAPAPADRGVLLANANTAARFIRLRRRVHDALRVGPI